MAFDVSKTVTITVQDSHGNAIPDAIVSAPWEVLASGDIKIHEGTANGTTDSNGDFLVKVDWSPVVIGGTQLDPLHISLLDSGTIIAPPRPSKAIPSTILDPGNRLLIKLQAI